MNRAGWVVASVGAATTITVGACTGPTVINTEDAGARTVSQAPPPPSTTRPSNTHLVNAYDYVARVDGVTGYYFTSPSGRWQCAIKPRVEAGCQNAAAPRSAIRITGAPEQVPGPGGAPEPPNAIRLDRTRDAEFVVVAPTAFGLDPDPAKELPYNRILAVAGFRCNVQEATGISCLSESSGAGFTFSADEYALRYVDVPPTAP